MVNADLVHDDVNTTSTSGAGQQRYVGYIPDLLRELSYVIQFDYDLRPVHDASFGHRRLDGSWDGMVGQLIHRVSQSVRMRSAADCMQFRTRSAMQFTSPTLT